MSRHITQLPLVASGGVSKEPQGLKMSIKKHANLIENPLFDDPIFLEILNNNLGGLDSLLFEYHYNIRWVDSMGVACDDFQVDLGLPRGFPYFQRHFPSTAVSQIAVKNPTRSRPEKTCQEIR